VFLNDKKSEIYLTNTTLFSCTYPCLSTYMLCEYVSTPVLLFGKCKRIPLTVKAEASFIAHSTSSILVDVGA